MGTEFQVMLVGTDPDYLCDVANEALDEVERVEARLSHYRFDSEISDLNLRAPYEAVLMERSVLELIQRAVFLSEATGGAFDCTAGPLVKCWGFFRGDGRLPDEAALREARARVGSRLLEIDAEARTVRFLREGVEVHLGAIGKGYAVDRVVETLRLLRIEAALVHGGTSTVYALGAPPGAEAWEIGIRDPARPDRRLGVVRLRDRALSTSGDYEQFFEVGGCRYSHILDPRTGYPARGTRSATVVAPSATDSDALSTAAFVLGAEGAARIQEQFPEIGALLVPDAGPDAIADVVILGGVDVTLGDDTGSNTGDPVR